MKFMIIGAGNGGQSMAAHLTFLKQDVVLYDIQEELIKQINQYGGIKAEGVIEGYAPVKATTDLEEAIDGADAIMVTTTGTAHKHVARSIAPYVKDGQVIMIFPGYWGALEFRNVFRELNVKENVYIAETESLIYTCRSIRPGHVRIRKIKEKLEFATLPANDGPKVKERFSDVYPQLTLTDSVLTTTLDNCNPIFHVPITLFNAGRIESDNEFFFYPDGATPSVVGVMEKLEEERLAIGKKLGIQLSTCQELLHRFYQVNEKSLYDSIQNNPAYQTGKAPNTLEYRYIYEDIPYGLNPMVKLGRALGLSMNVANLLIDIACLLRNEDLRGNALELADLGLDGMSADEVVGYLKRGERVIQ
ncbi:NAD/NADP octopine/nopaline dehydrogenase family protein [Lentibacillus sp. N15]|uniref:NAD/NADP octopine/nopaline dehydrogenase family protein n=1 Tax=Lentibacillus songyuanensis TaxID=3136161 RepID=UPI0031BBA380